MSQVLEPPQHDESDLSFDGATPDQNQRDPAGGAEFDYRPMPVLAPIAAVLGVLSLSSFLGLFGIALAMLGTLIGLIAFWQIRRSMGAYGGQRVALAGLFSSLVLGICGAALQFYKYKHEVPPGYQRVSFTQDISARKFIEEDGLQRVPPDVTALTGKPIFLKGFMYPTNQEHGLSSFLLLKDSGQCCFGGQPALQDMIGVEVKPGLDVDYYNGRVAVAGTLKLNANYQGGSLEPIYLFEADQFSKARTSF